MTETTFRGFPCPVFVQEFFFNGHKYVGIRAQVKAHLRECAVCRRTYARLQEEARQWDEDDRPGCRG